MKKYFILFIAFVSIIGLDAQIPTNCIEIESILVDACGAPEGENEMVRFQVGPSPINLASMTVSWPNNSWQGLCQNATTAGIVATWNTTITSCGLLIEPTGGIIPMGRHVILVSSTNVIPGANSFAGLSDTVYVIFQCAGNTLGHFANFGVGLRTLTISIGACNDIVTYDRALLEDQLGNNVAADGATVEFDWIGNPNYVNTGCNAPVAPLIVNAGIDQSGFCLGDTINLTGSTQGSFTSYNWNGGTGSFINPSSDTNAFYIVGIGETNPIQIFFTANNCNGNHTDTMNIFLNTPTPVNITPTGPITICNGDSITLTANGPGPFLWSNSATTQTITVSTAGTFIVSQTSACGISLDTVVINNNGLPPIATITPLGPTTLCAGASVTLQGSGGSSYVWSTSAITSSIIATLQGNYTLIVSNNCGSDTAFITLTSNPNPQVDISPTSPIFLCAGSVDITASGNGTMVWSNGDTNTVENYTAAGNYFVVASNACGTDTAFFTIMAGSITAAFTASPTVGSSPLIVGFSDNSTGAINYNWIFGDGNTSTQQNPTNTYTHPGTYTCMLIASNNAGCLDTAFITIIVDSCTYQIKIPNVMTIDGNGLNDDFFVTATCADQFNAYIFDRWGVKIYEYHDVLGIWNGDTFTGAKVNQGVYSYVIYLKDYNGDVHQYPGFIHVFE